MSITKKMRDREVWIPVFMSVGFMVVFSSTGDPVVGGLSAVIGYGVGLGVVRLSEATRSGQQIATGSEEPSVSAPLGIKALCVFVALITTVLVLGGLLGLQRAVASQDLWAQVEVILILGFGVVGAPVVYGLWTVTDWGWKGAIGWVGLGGLGHVLNWIIAEDASMNSTVMIIVSLVILLYLYRKRSLYLGEAD